MTVPTGPATRRSRADFSLTGPARPWLGPAPVGSDLVDGRLVPGRASANCLNHPVSESPRMCPRVPARVETTRLYLCLIYLTA